nr:HAD hydrolase-like protein [Corynebacterium lactis]
MSPTESSSPVSYRLSNSAPPTVLIDVDGTIADSLPAIVEGFTIAMRAIGHPIPDEDFLRTIPGPPMVETLASLGLSPDQVEAAFSAYMEHQRSGGWRRAEMFPGWPELLDRWRDDGLRLATATSKGEYFARKTLENFGLEGSFDFVGAADDDGTRRTKVDVIEYTLRRLGIGLTADQRPAGSVVMIGDRIHDFDGAARFGIPSIAVEWGYGSPEELAKADARVADAEDLDFAVRRMLYL